MHGLRLARLMKQSMASMAAVMIVAGVPAFDPIAAQDATSAGTPEQLASTIARTLAATNPAATSRNGITQQYSSHGNVVESRTLLETREQFRTIAANRADMQTATTRFLCSPERLPALQRGVVFHYVDVGPETSDKFDFLVDAQACASQPRSVQLDAQQRSVEAQTVARRLKSEWSSEQVEGLHLNGMSVINDTIRVVYDVTSPGLVQRLRSTDYEFRGITQGWVCGKVGASIRKGVKIDFVYQDGAGATLLAFAVDGATC